MKLKDEITVQDLSCSKTCKTQKVSKVLGNLATDSARSPSGKSECYGAHFLENPAPALLTIESRCGVAIGGGSSSSPIVLSGWTRRWDHWQASRILLRFATMVEVQIMTVEGDS